MIRDRETDKERDREIKKEMIQDRESLRVRGKECSVK